jgi:hypothetical protein
MQKNESLNSEPSFEFRCNVQWKDMRAVDATRERRRCGVCDRTVHLCRTLVEFDEHARLGHCVAVYEYGPFARITANSTETPDPLEDLPRPDPSLDPPFEVRFPTAGVPRMPELPSDDNPFESPERGFPAPRPPPIPPSPA